MAAPEPRSWGIEPVPERLRVLGTVDTGLLWGNLGVSLLVIVAGAALVPALSLPHALVAILFGCVIGNTMLGVAGAIGADARVPGMVLMRAPLGRRGSYLPTGINVLQGLGWSVFELLIIATAAAALSDVLFGFRGQWLWTLVFGAVALVLALLGPIGFVRRFVRRIAVWAVPFALGYLTWWAVDGADLGALWDVPGEGGLSVWQGADIVVAITVSWVPFAADYTRFSRSKRAGGVGSGVGYFVPDVWLLALGVLLVLSRDLSDPGVLPAAVVAGGFAAILALFALLVTETDEVFANVYSASVSLQNLAPRAPQPLLIVAVSAVATAGALVIDLVSYQSFLLLLGSVFVPLFAVLLADWLAGGRHYTEDDVFQAPNWRPGLVAAWIAGFALYHWLYPTGPAWWVNLVEKLDPPEWGLGATVPSFLASFVIAGAMLAISRRAMGGAVPV
ncbi:putative hydroxymethylpyrimidine transporter CytX [soil metagenome]